MATSEKYADEDDSGGVSKAEKKKAVDNMDVDEKTRQQIRSYLINGDWYGVRIKKQPPAVAKSVGSWYNNLV